MNLVRSDSAHVTRSLALLGASGSVGSTTLRYLRNLKKHSADASISLDAVSVHRSTDLLYNVLHEFSSIRHVAITDDAAFDHASQSIQSQYPNVNFWRGADGLVQMVEESLADTVLTAVVGASGIEPTMAAVRSHKKIALANKETLVTAGPAIVHEAMKVAQSGRPVSFLPVDSEHNAAFQMLDQMQPGRLQKLILTASGGPFRDYTVDQVRQVSRKQVLDHPTWKMGPKISVDSAGMINKGLEIIEAHFLFDLQYDQLDARIHRNSYVHAMAKTSDGSMLLAASSPDMVFPVAHALHYPDPVPFEHVADDVANWPALEFEFVSNEKYPGFSLCLEAGRRGGTAPAILNAANEVAVDFFLKDKIAFHQIPDLIAQSLDSIAIEDGAELGLFLEADKRTRQFLAQRYSGQRTRH